MSAALIKQFISCLQQDVKRLDTLTTMLEEQYELMSRRDSHKLETLNQQALALMGSLEHSHQERERLLKDFGLPNTAEGIRTLVSKLPEQIQQGTQQLLQELTLKARLCHAQNEKSGKLLANQRQIMQKLTGLDSRTSYPAMPL